MKKIVRITEGDLHRIVKKSVNRIIREMDDDWDEDEHEFYNEYGNQSQYPAYRYMEPDEGELGMTAQYDDEDIDKRLSDYDPEYFLNGKDDVYRSKMPGNYCTNESKIMRRRRMR